MVFDGVRKEESAARATYDAIGEGVKNINQVNVSPILEWGTNEVYLYLLKTTYYSIRHIGLACSGWVVKFVPCHLTGGTA